MSMLNRPDNFAGRVSYAAKVIASGRPTSRAFDNCFENYDNDEVAAAVYRRSLKNPKIATNIFRYLNREVTMESVERLKDVPTRKLAESARQSREKRRRAFEAEMAAAV